MKTLSENDFLKWAASKNIVPEERFPDVCVLSFDPDPGHDRFWIIPPEARRIPAFVHVILANLDPWDSIHVWKHSGSWTSPKNDDRMNDVVQATIYRGLDIPDDSADILVFDQSELAKVIAVAFAQLTFGWCVSDDLYLIPDHGQQLVKTDHHDVVHVSFLEEAAMLKFIAAMKEKGFDLPDEPPDETFKRPGWMEQ